MSLVCKDVMRDNLITLKPTDTVDKAFSLMRSIGMRFLPVVQEDGTYEGVFTSPTLIKLLLPRAATISISSHQKTSPISNLEFYPLDESSMSEALAEVGSEQVINYVSNPEMIPVLSPDTPVMEGILMLHKFKRNVVLVEPETKKFIGIVSVNSVLSQVFDETSGE